MQPANVLNISTLSDGWRDKDSVILHACFQVLVNFRKEELYNGIADWEADEDIRLAKKEIEELCSWWESYEEDSIPSEEKGAEENRMLIRLINVRWALWT